MSWIDTGVIGGVFVLLAFVAAGFLAARSGTRGPLEAGPYWHWGLATALVAGGGAELAEGGAASGLVAPLLGPVFTAFLVAGALRYCDRSVPLALFPAAVVVGLARALAESGGWLTLSGVLSLLVEPVGALLAAWLVFGEARQRRASWVHRALPFAFLGLACAEGLGASRTLFGLDRLIVWPLWLAAGIPLVVLQLATMMERADRAEDESLRDREDRERANARLQLLANNIREVISEIGSDGRLLWVSDSCRDQLGLEPEALIGRPYLDTLRELGVENLDEQERVRLLGGSAEGAAGPSDLRARIHSARDGSGNERFFETRLARERVSRVLAFSRDITAQIAAQRALAASEERFRKFSLLGSDYCFVTTGDLAGGPVENFTTGTLEEISGYTDEDFRAIGFRGFIHPDDHDAGRDRVVGLLRDGGESSHEFRIVTKSGETRWIAEKLLVERSGSKYTVYGAARDISERRHLAQALASAQKLDSLGLLAGGIAHDFNNLLMVILGNTEMALDAAGTSEAARSDLEAVVDAVEQAQSLTQQLLAYAGRGAVEQVPVDLSERVRSVSELLAVAGAADVDVGLDLKQGLPAVVADPGEMQQLTMNLVLNAIEACEGGGRVDVSARPTGPSDRSGAPWLVGQVKDETDYVVLEVRDDGVGMDAATLANVFDPFFTTKTAGRGLGLAAVIGIVRSIDGAIRVESEPGNGTRFVVLLPASAHEISASEKPALAPAADAAVGKILVVDDDERVQQVAVRMLRARGFEVSTANDGRAAIDACERDAFDVILLDAVMPGLTAAETFDGLRAAQPGVPVLMVSGFDMERAAGDLLDRGLAGFVGKPFRRSELLARIGAAMGTPA